MTTYPYSGADISYAQGNPAASSFPGQFVILNASRANVGLVVGSQYHAQVATMRAAGKWIGHYFFNGPVDVTTCANFFVANLYDHQPGDILALDIESTGVTAWTPAQALVFVQRVYALTGKKCVIYLNKSLVRGNDWSALVAFGSLLWLADYDNDGYPSGQWPVATLVQTSSSGFDHDLSSKTFAEINGGTTPIILESDDMKLIRDSSTGSIAAVGVGYYYPYGKNTGTDLTSVNATSKVWGAYVDLTHDEFLVNVASAVGTYQFDLSHPYLAPWDSTTPIVTAIQAAFKSANIQIDSSTLQSAIESALAASKIEVDTAGLVDAIASKLVVKLSTSS